MNNWKKLIWPATPHARETKMELSVLWFTVSFIVLAIIVYIYKYGYSSHKVLERCGVKSPPSVPFFGHFFQIIKGFSKFQKELFDKYGPITGYYVGQLPVIMVVDAEILKQVTVKQFDTFVNRNMPMPKMFNGRAPFGILSDQGQVWKDKRNLLSPTFSSTKLRLMVPHIERSTKTLIEIVGRNANTGESLNFFKLYGSFTMETILATAFGREIDVQRGEASSIADAARAILSTNRYVFPLVDLIMSNFPWIDHLLAFFMKPDPAFTTLYSTCLTLVKTRRKEGRVKHKDLLQLMMDATGDDEEKEEGETSDCPINPTSKRQKKFTDEEVVHMAITMLIAGYETTANTLTFISYLLALHPDTQEKLQTEIDSYYEEHPDESLYVASSNIKFLDMVIQESLRLYPVANRTSRVCSKTTTINGVLFPKECKIAIPIHLLHRDTRYWDDPDKFDPMRFTPEEKAKRHQLCHIPFGFGPRNCIGMRLALLETKIVFIELLKRYTFVKAPDTEVPLQVTDGITIVPTNGMYLNVASRS